MLSHKKEYVISSLPTMKSSRKNRYPIPKENKSYISTSNLNLLGYLHYLIKKAQGTCGAAATYDKILKVTSICIQNSIMECGS